MNKKNRKNVGYHNFEEMMEFYKTAPKKVFLWNGIKEGSFGLIFGPPKSGKTIFCENLAMNLAIGAKEFMGYDLIGKEQKVLFVGLEEFWMERIERNISQYKTFNNSEKELIKKNYIIQKIDFSRKIVSENNWNDLKELIRESKAKTVFIDSITRMNHGKLEDSKTAEEIMQRLRELCHSLSITLVCIHHTPKLFDKGIFMDSIKGSSTFSAESDFAIGVNRTSKNYRYFKNIFFRYASDSDDSAQEFELDDNLIVNFIAKSDEDEVLARSDRRRANDKKSIVLNYFSKNPDKTYSKNELIDYFMPKLNCKERMVENYLQNAVENKYVVNPQRGFYKFNSDKS